MAITDQRKSGELFLHAKGVKCLKLMQYVMKEDFLLVTLMTMVLVSQVLVFWRKVK